MALANHQPLLAEFAGPERIEEHSPFWQSLLRFPVALCNLSPAELEAGINPYCDGLVRHNASTGHFQKLVQVLCASTLHFTERKAPHIGTATNAVVFLRVLLKRLIENLNVAQLDNFLDHSDGSTPVATNLVRVLAEVLILSKHSAALYALQWETLNLLLVAGSSQLFTPTPCARSPFFDALAAQNDLAPPLLQTLLQHYVERATVPPGTLVFMAASIPQRSVFRFVRRAAASVLWLPLQALTFLVRSNSAAPPAPGEAPPTPLADTALLLLLALLHHCPGGQSTDLSFRGALAGLQDAAGTGSHDAAESGRGTGGAQGRAAISFSALHGVLGVLLTQERTVLLMYNLLRSCPAFYAYVLARRNPEALLLPMLATLYSAPGGGRSSSHAYMLLIVLLVLSQDAAYAQRLHAVRLPGVVPWYRERFLHGTSLGSLVCVVLVRTAHYNLARLRDAYLHANALAALANLAPHAAGLSPLACQRLVALLAMLGQRYRALMAPNGAAGTGGAGLGATGAATPPAAPDEAASYAEFLRIVLEIVNCCVVTNLGANPELVYALLHRQEELAPLLAEPGVAGLGANLATLLRFFNERVDGAGQPQPSVQRVHAVIAENLEAWQDVSLQPASVLRFSYEEEEAPEEFFVPYIWTLIVAQVPLGWTLHAIALFTASALQEDDSGLMRYGSECLDVRVESQ